jgi:hypothetical protein
MSGRKISDLPAADPLDGSEQVPIVQASETRRTTTGGLVISSDVTYIVTLTQAQYNSLDPKDPNTLYVVVD